MGPSMAWNKMWGVRQVHWANEQSVEYARRHLIALSLEWQLGKYAARSRLWDGDDTDTIAVGVRESDEAEEEIIDGDALEGLSSIILS
jgi:hypothetical protein